MSYEICESAGEKAIELDQDNRKNGGRGKQNSHYKKGVGSTPPRSLTRGFDGA